MDSLQNALKNKLSAITACTPQNIHLFFKGRVALYYLLKSAGIKSSDEVIIQGFSCVAVANAVLQAGATPIYVDISSTTLNTTADEIRKKLSPKTKAVLIQNTFGLSNEVTEIKNLCEPLNIVVIEDCTHGLGGLYNNSPNGSHADAAFYSTQWSKPFTSGIGGIATINNPNKFPNSKQAMNQASPPPLAKEFSLLLQNLTYSIVAYKFSLHILRTIYQFLYTHSIVTGSSTQKELETPMTVQPEPWKMGFVQTLFALLRISGLKKKTELRKSLGLLINEKMRLNDKFSYHSSDLKNHSFLRYPAMAKNREAVTEYLRTKYKIVPGDWFFSPIYPVKTHMEKWNYTTCVNAEEICKKIINLPTEDRVILKILEDKNFLDLIE